MQRSSVRQGAERNAPKKKRHLSRRKAKLLRILMITGLALLLLIPTYFAIGSYFVVKNAPDDTTETYFTSLDITGPTGMTFHVPADAPEGTDEAKLFACFNGMLTDAVITPDIKTTHSSVYQVARNTNTGVERFTFYFAPDDVNCYYTDSTGTVRRSPEGSAEYFLNSTYSYELYPEATPPVLVTGSTDRVIPSEMSWRYQTQNGLFSDLAYFTVTDEIITYPIQDNAITFKFEDALTKEEVSPTTCTLAIYKNGQRIHSGDSVTSISIGTLEDGEILDFEIIAEYSNNSLSYRGTVVYHFKMFAAAPTTFTFEKDHGIRVGEFFVLSCENVQNEENLVITSADGLLSPPVIFKRNDIVYALIPTIMEGSFELIVEYGSTRLTFNLTVEPNTDFSEHILNSNALRGDWQAAVNGLLKGRIEAMGATGDSAEADRTVLTLRDSFAQPGGTLALGFGDTALFGDSRLSLPFELYTGSYTVTATALGRVLRVGTDDLLGNFVVLDHGCGLYSWYCGLSRIQVEVGDDVAEGQTLGKTGQTGLGFAGQDGMMLMVTTGKVAIDPDYLRSYSFNIGAKPTA